MKTITNGIKTAYNWAVGFVNARPALKRYLVSSLTTFMTTFTAFLWLTLGSISAGQAVTGSFILAALSAGFRAAWKAVIEGLLQQHADKLPAVAGNENVR